MRLFSLLLRPGPGMLLLCLVLVGGTGSAQEAGTAVPAGPPPAVEAPKLTSAATGTAARTWKGEAEAGLVATSGNTETQSLTARFRIEWDVERWRFRLNAQYLKASDKGGTTAERSSSALKTDYRLSRREYLFGLVRYDGDRFSGYHSQIAESLGYGRRFPFSEATTLEAEAGAGGQHTRFVGGARERHAIVRLAMKFVHRFGTGSEFREEAFTEIADANTHTESVTSLTSRLNSSFATKLAYTVKRNSSVPPGLARTDTITSVTLVYDL